MPHAWGIQLQSAVFPNLEKTMFASTLNNARKYGVQASGWARSKVAAVSALALAGASAAHAELPASIATDVAAAKTDMLAAIALVIGAMVAVWGLLKLASKLGWR